MILELAQITVRPSTEAQFESVFPNAIRLLAASSGYLSHELHPPVVEHFATATGQAASVP